MRRQVRARPSRVPESAGTGRQRVRWTESIVAAGLGAVVLAVPLAVLGGAMGPYDDPKAWALVLLVGGTGVVWLLGRTVGGSPRGAATGPDTAARLLRWAVLAYGAWWGATTLASLAPGQSFWGSFGRGHGLVTLGAAILLFALVQAEAPIPQALRALVDLALLGSVPVCLLALGQALGWDPLPRAWDPATAPRQMRSTFGVRIFLGSYLVMLIPLAMARLEAARAVWRDSHPRWRLPSGPLLVGALWVAGALGLVTLASRWPVGWWALVPWGVAGAIGWTLVREREEEGPSAGPVGLALLAALLAGQVLIVAFSGARGPFLGMLVGLSLTGFALVILRRAWKTLTAGAAGLGVALVFLVLLNLPASPLAPLKSVPLLSRLGALAEVERSSAGWFRLQVWGGILSAWGRQLGGEVVIPGVRPRLRSLLGYGLETQLLTLDRLAPPGLGTMRALLEGWVDRAHNDLLDHLVTGGLGGVGLWALVVGGVVTVGVRRIRTSASREEAGLRLGCLGAILAHLAEGQVGIATPMPRALFWIVAAILTLPPWTQPSAPRGPSRPGVRAGWAGLTVGAACLVALLAWGSTRWLLGSVAYAGGMRRVLAGEISAAHREFQRASALAPWLPLPHETLADISLRLAAREEDPARRLALLREAEATLAESRRYLRASAAPWTLTGQVALAQFRAGEQGKLTMALDAFATAARLRPGEPRVLAQWGLAWLEAGDPRRARELAEQSVALGPREWLGWAVLARAARQLGEHAEANRAAAEARRHTPSDARGLLPQFLP